MNTREPRRNDELAFIIRETLRVYVSDQKPSDTTWDRIRSALDGDEQAQPQRRRFFWIAPALQAALILLLCVLQGVGPSYAPQVQTTVTPAHDVSTYAPYRSHAEVSEPFFSETSMYVGSENDVRLLRQLGAASDRSPRVATTGYSKTFERLDPKRVLIESGVDVVLVRKPLRIDTNVDSSTGLPQ